MFKKICKKRAKFPSAGFGITFNLGFRVVLFCIRIRKNIHAKPAISVLLLLVLTVATSALAYGAYNNWISAQSQDETWEIQERIKIEDVKFTSNATATLLVFNVGTIEVNITLIEINDEVCTIISSNPISPRENSIVTVTYPLGFIIEDTYLFKILSADGNTVETTAKYTGA